MQSAIKIDHLTKVFALRTILDDLSFEVAKGQIHGFLGPNGAGKSTTMKVLAGILAPSSGSVEIAGLNLDKDLNEIKTKIGILPENLPLYLDMTVEDYLNLALSLRGMKSTAHYQQAIEKTGLGSVQKRLIGNLSKGFKQRVGIAQAIVFKPEIIILDEPTSGLDPASILEIRHLIKELAKDHTVVYSSHLLHEVALSCSHITIIHQGKIITSGSMEEVTKRFEGAKVVRFEFSHLPQEVGQSVKQFNFVKKVEMEGNKLQLHLSSKEEKRPELLNYFLEKKLNVLEMVQERTDLEHIFLELTQNQGNIV